jgi:hypothetical protein
MNRGEVGLEAALAELAAPGPPALGSALAWSGAMAAAVIEMAAVGGVREQAARSRERLLRLGREDARAYRRFLVSAEDPKLQLLEEATRLPLEIAREARRLRDAARGNPGSSEARATDIEGSVHLLTSVAAGAARLAGVNAQRGGERLETIAREAARILTEEATTLSGWNDSGPSGHG